MLTKLVLPIFVLLTFLAIANSATTKRSNPSTDFIKVSCTATRYPSLCVKSLMGYAPTVGQSPKQLAQAALTVSLNRARSATTFVSRMCKAKGVKSREYQVMKDCVDNMGDSVDRLSRSIKELGSMGQAGSRDFMWHVSNVQTWVSAALTDENTCVDGFSERAMDERVKAAVKARVLNVAQVTSNALALVNRFANRHY